MVSSVIPALLYLLEVPAQRVAGLVRGRVHDGRGLARHGRVLVLALRPRVPVLVAHAVLLLALFTAVDVILQLYAHLTLCRLIPGSHTIYYIVYNIPSRVPYGSLNQTGKKKQ